MAWIPDCIERLGLEMGADERAVKRAYARALKKIDQELAPDDFQKLRSDYEAALQWVRTRAQPSEDEVAEEESPAGNESNWTALAEAVQADDAGEAIVSADQADKEADQAGDEAAEERDDASGEEQSGAAAARAHRRPFNPPPGEQVARADLLAGAVLEALVADINREPRDKQKMRELLARHLEDSRLEALDVKEEFEKAVLHLLIGGWRPGNEILFGAARELFNWRDVQRLKRFGAAGCYLDEACREASSFNQQPDPVRAEQLDVMRRLREEYLPDVNGGLHQIRVAGQLVNRYPHLASVLSDVRRIETWQALEPELRARAEEINWKNSPMVWFFALVFVAFFGLWYGGKRSEETLQTWKQATADKAAETQPTGGRGPALAHRSPPANSQVAESVGKLIKEIPNVANCGQAYWIASAYGVGYEADLGLDFDRYVLACVATGRWGHYGASDLILNSARERIRRNS